MKTGDRQYTEQRAESFPMPAVGPRVLGDFICQGEIIHVVCSVERQRDRKLVLRVLSEMGRIPLAELSGGMVGQMEVESRLFPLQVLRVDFPTVEVAVFPDQAGPARRESLRIPASFSVRLRPSGESSPWMNGKGLDISTDGFRVILGVPSVLHPRVLYEVELLLSFPQGESEALTLSGEVRWSTMNSRRITAGLQVQNPSHLQELARTVYRLQHQLFRHPEDYLCLD